MDNIILGHDPLLYKYGMQGPQYRDMAGETARLEEMMKQYQEARKPEAEPHDYLGELDNAMKSIGKDTMKVLETDEEFSRLNMEIQGAIQNEIIRYVKHSVNANPETVSKIQRVREIIDEADRKRINEERKNMTELNDYIKNYSDMTFNDYKKLKNSQQS